MDTEATSTSQLNLADSDAAALQDRISDLMPRIRADLESLVAIPCVNMSGFEAGPVAAAAEECARLLRAAGAEQVELIDSDTPAPTVRAEIPGPPGSPTVILYSHYDVQPAGDIDKWESPPFEATERGGRLYGRGVADDKSGVVTHIATLAAFDGKPPVNIRILLEGCEEGGGDFEEWPKDRPEQFADADAAVICDMGNVRIGQPTFTTELRGIVEGIVTVRTLAGPLHSGQFGGPAPDALMVLIKLLSTLQDSAGNCAVAGIPGSEWPGADFPEDDFRELAGVLPGIPLVGDGSIASRLYSKPAVSVVGLDAPEVDTAPNAIIPMARAKVSMRIPADADSDAATAALEDHLRSHVPYGIDVEFEAGPPANGCRTRLDGPAFSAFSRAMRAAYGDDPTTQGMGGAVPFMANLIEEFPDLEVLGVGAQDPMARIHAPNESVDMAELERSIVAQVLFLAEFGATTRQG